MKGTEYSPERGKTTTHEYLRKKKSKSPQSRQSPDKKLSEEKGVEFLNAKGPEKSLSRDKIQPFTQKKQKAEPEVAGATKKK